MILMGNKLAIIALRYLEPEWEETVKCLEATGLPIYYAERDGVGSMSRAFNDAWNKFALWRYEYVWFVTNITFSPDVPFKLMRALIDDKDYAGIHPAMHSDHPFLKPDNSGKIKTVGFIEFTAPMFRSAAFDKFKLDENVWYYYFDLILCDLLSSIGQSVVVHHGCEIGHTYLRNGVKHRITLIREQLRDLTLPAQKQYMRDNFGLDWEQKLRFQHYA